MGKELCKSCLSGKCLKDGEDGKLTMSQPHGLQSAGLAGLHWDQVRTPPSLLTAELKPSHFGKGEPYKQKNVAPLKTDKRRATGMVSEQEIWAKTGWTGALPGEMMEGEGLEETGAERLWGLSPESPLLKEGCNCSYVFDRLTKTRVWQATGKVGARQWEHDLGQPQNKKNSSVTATEIRTPQGSSLNEKPAFSLDSSTSEVSPQVLPARLSLHRQQTGQRALPCKGAGGPWSSWWATEAGVEDKRKDKTLRKYLDSMLGNEAWLRPVSSGKM